jgi:hypothetical protein
VKSTFARLVAILFVLLAAACEPAPPRGSEQPSGPSATTRWFLGLDEPSCLERGGDYQVHTAAPQDPDAIQRTLGAPGLPDNPRTMLVRVPILNALLAYAKATDKSAKEKYANELRAHFKSDDRSDGIPASAAKAFREMLLDPGGKDKDALVVVFRNLNGDPLAAELLQILYAKYGPPPAEAAKPATTPASADKPADQAASAAASSSPATAPTTEEAFTQAHKDIKEAIAGVRAGTSQLSEVGQKSCNNWFNERADFVQKCLTVAEKMKTAALEATDQDEKAAGIKAASVTYVSVFYIAQLSQLMGASLVVSDWAAQQKPEKPAPEHVGLAARAVAGDPDLQALMDAALLGNDPVKLGAAMVKGVPKLRDMWGQLQDVVKLSSDSAELTKKVIIVADLLMLAHSFASMKLPAVSGGGPAGALAIAGTSGGAAVMSAAQLARITAALEAIQKLIALGAIQAAPAVAVIAGGHTALASTAGGTPNVPSPASIAAQPADLQPYNKGGGHHVPAKRAFEGAPGYDANKALAIPKAELERLAINHNMVTTEQMKAYKAFAQTGQPLTWDAIAKIEAEALVKAGMKPDVARATLAKAIQVLKDAGIPAPLRIPWGG